jgi:hypothetical protein
VALSEVALSLTDEAIFHVWSWSISEHNEANSKQIDDKTQLRLVATGLSCLDRGTIGASSNPFWIAEVADMYPASTYFFFFLGLTVSRNVVAG